MNEKVTTALARLNGILPLLAGLQSLGDDEARLYCMLLNRYAETGKTLTREEIAGIIDNAEQVLERVVASQLVVLDENGEPAGAYPFTSQPREHRVRINDATAHCMCALDALSVSAMFERPSVIDSECRVTGQSIHLEQNGLSFNDGNLDAWFGINWGAAASDIVCAESLCLEMMFLANREVAERWLDESPHSHEIFDLQSALEFAAAFFVPLARHCRGLADAA